MRPFYMTLSAICLAAFCTCSTAETTLSPSTNGLLLHLPMDGNLNAVGADPHFSIKTDGITFVAGKHGQAMRIADDSKGIEFAGAGYFNRPIGTVMYWIQPAWEFAQEAAPVHREMFRLDNFTVNYHPPKQALVFMTGKTFMGDGYKWDYGCWDSKINRTWKPGQWHHVAVTWDSETGRKSLYLDGLLAVTNLTKSIRNDTEVGTITFGGPNAPGLYDDLMIWNRVLSDNEIQKYGQVSPPKPAADTAAANISEPIRIQMDQLDAASCDKGVIAPGESYTAHIQIKNQQAQAFKAKLNFTLLDYWENALAQQSQVVDVLPQETKTLDIAFAAPANGIFKIRMNVDGDEAARKILRQQDVAGFIALPENMGQDGANSFFGAHVNSWTPGMPKLFARLGLGWVRGHNMLQFTWWPRVEPDPGQWVWEDADQHQRMVDNRMNILGQFFGTPYWAAADGALERPSKRGYPSGARPDLKAFANYVTKVVRQYPDVRYWEVWNEPDASMFWNGSPEQFAELANVAYDALKQADPSAKAVIGGLTQPSWRWHEAAAKAGMLKKADALSCHLYHSADMTPEEFFEKSNAVLGHFRKLCRETRGSDLPIWDTESGSGDTTWFSGVEFNKFPPMKARPASDWQSATRMAVQTAAIMQSQGVARSFFYLANVVSRGDEEYRSLNGIDVNNLPKPKLVARAVMAWQLRDCQYVSTVRHDAGRVWAVIYRTSQNQSVALLWAGEEARVSLAAQWPENPNAIINMMGNAQPIASTQTLTQDPIYIRLPVAPEAATTALQLAKLKIEHEPKVIVTKVENNNAEVPALPNYVAAAENPEGVFTVDLRKFATMGLKDEIAGDSKGGWADEGPFNDAAQLPTGRQTFYGVPFDIIKPETNQGKSVLTLFGMNLTKRMPKSVANIPIQQKTRVLYFLHAAAWGEPGTIGKYIIHYSDGQTLDLPIQIPTNCNNWWFGWDEKEDGRPIPFRVSNTLTGKPAWRYLRTWEWQNPRRDIMIDSIDVVSAGGVQTPIIVAITGVRMY